MENELQKGGLSVRHSTPWYLVNWRVQGRPCQSGKLKSWKVAYGDGNSESSNA